MKNVIFAKLDVKFFQQPKVLSVGKDGKLLYLAALCYARDNLTDGVIHELVLPMLAAMTEMTDIKQTVTNLVSSCLWDVKPNGYQIHHYFDFNPSAEQVRELSELRAEAGKQGGRPKSTPKPKPNKNQNANQNAKQSETKTKAIEETETETETETDSYLSQATEIEKDKELFEPPTVAIQKSDKFDFKKLWELAKIQAGHTLTWSYEIETKCVKVLLKLYPDDPLTPEDLVAFLAYRSTCYGVDKNSQPTFSGHKQHFGAWYSNGKPATQAIEGSNGNGNRANYGRTAKEIASNESIAEYMGRKAGRPPRTDDYEVEVGG